MSEMVERVARALAYSHYDQKILGRFKDREAYVRSYADERYRFFLLDARAAIEAMRIPTEVMIKAADARDGRCTPYDELYRAMIDAILSEREGE